MSDKIPTSIQEVIDMAGGVDLIASRLELKSKAVYIWNERQGIPNKHRATLARIINHHGYKAARKSHLDALCEELASKKGGVNEQ